MNFNHLRLAPALHPCVGMSQYVHDISEAALDDELLQSEQPILVDFWAPWCAPCRAMTPALEAAAKELWGNARVFKINVDDNPSVSPHFNVKGIPTLILFKGGQVHEQTVGAVPKSRLTQAVQSAVG